MLDPEMMSYNAGWPISYVGYDPTTGCIDWPEPEWPAFEHRLAAPSSDQGYFYVQDDQSGEFLGHVHYQVDPEAQPTSGSTSSRAGVAPAWEHASWTCCSNESGVTPAPRQWSMTSMTTALRR